LIGKAYGCAVTRISKRAEVKRIPDLIRAPGPQFIVVDTSVQAIISRASNVREAIE
jgi:acetolactate synthase-1/2/3 large subunit